MPNKRKKSNLLIAGVPTAQENAYNDFAGAVKKIPLYGSLIPLGAANAVTLVSMGATIFFYNNSDAVDWVAFGDGSVTAPSGGADGLPIPANTLIGYSAADNSAFISIADTTFAYLLQDETFRS
jgi:hypothetical protein